MHNAFDRFAGAASSALGSSWAFIVTVVIIAAWLIGGLFIGFGDWYQIVINTVSTLTTSIFVVLIQNTQNRESKAMNLKLDELLRASAARNDLIDAEHMSDDDLRRYQQEFDRRRREGLV